MAEAAVQDCNKCCPKRWVCKHASEHQLKVIQSSAHAALLTPARSVHVLLQVQQCRKRSFCGLLKGKNRAKSTSYCGSGVSDPGYKVAVKAASGALTSQELNVLAALNRTG
jgi:hypothetical protein